MSVVLEELYNNNDISAYDFEGIVIDAEIRKTMELVMIDKFDPLQWVLWITLSFTNWRIE